MKFARESRKQLKRGTAARAFACESLEDRRMFAGDCGQQLVGELVEPLAQPLAVASTNAEATPLALADPDPTAYTPAQMRHAYGYDQIFFEGGSIVGDGTGQTIAIVNAYHTPTALADLNAFSTEFGLPPPPTFSQVSQTGGDPSAIPTNGNWALETALDIQWAHAFAPGASILLVEATSATFGNLTAAVSYARSVAGVSVISMSWGSLEFATELNYDTNFTTPSNHAGVVFAAAAGNAGSPGMYPAYSPNTLAVGGTTLGLDGNGNITGEQAWSHGGGGISQYETQPSWQNGFVTQSATMRTMPDVAFLADPATGVPVYDSFNNGNATPWVKVAGTSFATPSWGALVAIADQGRNLAGKPVLDGPTLMSMLYAMPASNFNDITIGSSTGATPQAATPGYDLVTGRGTPKAQLIVGDLVGVGAVSGTVFSDANSNGLNDGDSGLAGWTVYSDLNNNSAFDPVTVNTFNSTNVPLTIPNNTTITSNNTVPALAGRVIDVNVTVNISHNSDNNLTITLISPTGTHIVLADGVGGSGNHFTNTEFDDSASILIDNGTAPFASTFHPEGLLSVLYGTNPQGVWQLEIKDNTLSTTGTLNSWSLEITTGDPNTTTGANGMYTLANLPPASHKIREVLQAPYSQTAPPGGFYTVNVTAGGSATGRDFGNHAAISAAPLSVALLAASDTGSSNSDHITKLNNSSAGSVLQFQVSGTISGATVTLYADGNVIGSAMASGSTTVVTTDGLPVHTLADGMRSITARQTEPAKAESSDSPAQSITVDTAAPTAAIVPVSPDPRTSPVASIDIDFSEAVSGLDLSRLTLTRDAGSNLLSGAQTVSSGENISWTLANLATLTGVVGFYELDLLASGPPISDVAGNLYSGSESETFTVLAGVVGRHLFYNQSGTSGAIVRYDGNDATINSLDDNAIASDKAAYLPGTGPATFTNVSGYSKGINGLMIDIAGSHPSITAADFVFRVGNNNTPNSWATAPAPLSVSVRAGAGVSGSDRVEIIWANSAIAKTWLQVITLANANTGLSQKLDYPAGEADVFFFGNAVGNSGLGDTATNATVNATDEIGARNNPANLAANIPITNIYDYDRNAQVNAADQIASRNNATNPTTVLKYLNIGSPPLAPQSDDGSGVASLTAAGPDVISPQTATNVASSALPATDGVDRARTFAPGVPVDSTIDRKIFAHADFSGHWLTFVDEQLLDLLATGQPHAGSRRRK
jgi:subtilisin-like proprotein convertase family protein